MKKIMVILMMMNSILALADSTCGPDVRFEEIDFNTQNVALRIEQSIAIQSGYKHFQVGYIKIHLANKDTSILFQGEQIRLTGNLGIALQSQIDDQQTNILACKSKDIDPRCEIRFFSPDMTLGEFNKLSDNKLSITCL